MEALRAEGILTEEGVRNFRVEQGVLECVPCASGQEARQLLFACGGLWEPPSGTVEVFGRQLYRMDGQERAVFRRRNIGVVDAENNLIPGLNLYENVILSSDWTETTRSGSAEKLQHRQGWRRMGQKSGLPFPGKGPDRGHHPLRAGGKFPDPHEDRPGNARRADAGSDGFLHRIQEQRGLTQWYFPRRTTGTLTGGRNEIGK